MQRFGWRLCMRSRLFGGSHWITTPSNTPGWYEAISAPVLYSVSDSSETCCNGMKPGSFNSFNFGPMSLSVHLCGISPLRMPRFDSCTLSITFLRGMSNSSITSLIQAAASVSCGAGAKTIFIFDYPPGIVDAHLMTCWHTFFCITVVTCWHCVCPTAAETGGGDLTFWLLAYRR